MQQNQIDTITKQLVQDAEQKYKDLEEMPKNVRATHFGYDGNLWRHSRRIIDLFKSEKFLNNLKSLIEKNGQGRVEEFLRNLVLDVSVYIEKTYQDIEKRRDTIKRLNLIEKETIKQLQKQIKKLNYQVEALNIDNDRKLRIKIDEKAINEQVKHGVNNLRTFVSNDHFFYTEKFYDVKRTLSKDRLLINIVCSNYMYNFGKATSNTCNIIIEKLIKTGSADTLPSQIRHATKRMEEKFLSDIKTDI